MLLFFGAICYSIMDVIEMVFLFIYSLPDHAEASGHVKLYVAQVPRTGTEEAVSFNFHALPTHITL